MRLLVMAWRNLFRYWRRTLITLAAMTLALFTMLVWSSLIEGIMQSMETNILEVEMGDLQIFAPEYRNRPSIYERIEDPAALLDELDSLGFRSSARLLGGGLLAAGDSAAGVQLRGVDIERDALVSKVYQHLDDGEWLDSADPSGVVLGHQLARILGVEPGDELVALSQATDGSMANDLFYVRGVLRAVSDSTDRSGVFMTQEAFRSFFVLPLGVHQVVLRHPADQELTAAAGRVRQAAPELEVKSWRELVPTLASYLDTARSTIQIFYFVVYIVVAILLINTMLMTIFERIRELGVLKAVGVGPGKIVMLIFLEGGLQALIATVLGLLLSIPALHYLSRTGLNIADFGGSGFSFGGATIDPIWRAVVTPASILGPVIALAMLVFVAILYPAVKAARVSPVQAMRHQ